VQDILPAMILHGLSGEAKGKMKKGDRIVKIDNDDITTWTLARGKV
jgi:membrane-associated protease RseP (regulator of RpoE activity)